MTFLSPITDFEKRTLSTLSTAFERIAYLEGLYQAGEGFCHWGLERIHGRDNARSAIRAAYISQVGELVGRAVAELWTEYERVPQDGEVPVMAERVLARGELSRLRREHLSLTLETIAALRAARSRSAAA